MALSAVTKVPRSLTLPSLFDVRRLIRSSRRLCGRAGLDEDVQDVIGCAGLGSVLA